MPQLLTPQIVDYAHEMAKRGPDINFTAYVYAYIFAVKLETGPMFALLKLKPGPFFVFWGFLFLKISFSLQKEEDF